MKTRERLLQRTLTRPLGTLSHRMGEGRGEGDEFEAALHILSRFYPAKPLIRN